MKSSSTSFKPQRPWNIHALAVAVFAGSVVITLAFWTVLPSSFRVTMDTDYAGFYEPVARSIAAGHGITDREGAPATRYPPGYPLLLSSAFWLAQNTSIPEAVAASALTLLCVGLASTSLFLLVRQVFGSGTAVAAAALWVTYPFVLWLTKEPMSEIPFMASLYLALCVFWRASHHQEPLWPWYALVGALIGLSMLIRPIAMGLGVLLALLIVFRGELAWRRRLAFGNMILLGNLAVVAPWELWVHSQTGRFVLLSSGGTPSVIDGLTYAVRGKGYRRGVAIPSDVRELIEDLSDRLDSTDDGRRPGSLPGSDRQLSTLGDVVATLSAELRERPVAVLKLFGQKALRSWYGMDSARYEWASLLMQGLYMALVIWGGLIAWKQGGEPRQYVILVASLALYFCLMTTLVLSILRYMVPAMGLLITLIPVALSRRKFSAERGLPPEHAHSM